MKKRSMKFIFSIAVAVFALAIILLAVRYGDALLYADLQYIRDMTDDTMALSLIVMLLIMVVQNMFTIIPLILVVSINISLFDFGLGIFWSWLTSLVGASIAFFTVRLWLQQAVSGRLNPSWVNKIEKNGFLYVLIARMIPVAPNSLINFAAGVSSVKYTHFISSTAIGNLLYFCVVSLIIYGLIPNILDFGGYVLAGLVVIGFVVARIVKRRRSDKDIDVGS